MKDYYKILGVNSEVSVADIKKAFRRKALLLHPDKSKQDTKEAFVALYEAYAILSDKNKRITYDRLRNQVFSSNGESHDEELRKAGLKISAAGEVYAGNFKKFQREVLGLILMELFFGIEDLLIAALASLSFGTWTFVSGLFSLSIAHLIIGVGLMVIGLLLAKRKLRNIQCYVADNVRK